MEDPEMEDPQQPSESKAPALPDGAFDGPGGFAAAVRAALDAAAAAQWREIMLADADFADWPLGERAVVESLQAWAGSGRVLVMVAEHFNVFERAHARFVHWRQMWGHIIEPRVCSGPGLPAVPSAIWTPAWALRRIDTERSRGVCGRDPADRHALREMLAECLKHGRPGFPARTLGL